MRFTCSLIVRLEVPLKSARMRQYDGYYYLIYAGRTEGQAFARRGWNQLGLARSSDLMHWSPAGRTQ